MTELMTSPARVHLPIWRTRGMQAIVVNNSQSKKTGRFLETVG